MEILIVTAVIAILIAVAIPVFSAQLEKSRKAVCLANRRSLLSVCYADAVTTEANVADRELQTAFAKEYTNSADAQKNYVCPSGGKYTWSGGNILCSKHGLETLTAGIYTFSPSVNVKDIPTSFPANLNKGELYQLDGNWYVMRNKQTNFKKPGDAETWLRSYGTKLDFTQTPLTSDSFNGKAYSYYGAFYQSDDGNLYVQIKSATLTQALSNTNNTDYWTLVGKAA